MLQGAHNEAGSHIHRLKTQESALVSVSMAIPALLGVSAVAQELVQDLLSLVNANLFLIH